MPELPEVETIKKDLEKLIIGKKITRIELLDRKLIKGIKPESLLKESEGKLITKIIRRGKYLVFALHNKKFLIFHLKLNGQLIYGRADKKSRIIFYFDRKKEGLGKGLNFLDQRRFAELRLTTDWSKETGIRDMGPEPFDKDFSLEKFRSMLKNRKTKVKPLLMDQKFIAGIGNIYAQETLFRIGVRPERTADKLSPGEVENLYQAIKDVLEEALEYRGSSVDSYLDTRGKKGGMEKRLKVYGRGGEPCKSCGTMLKEIKLGGRGTVYCPGCQK